MAHSVYKLRNGRSDVMALTDMGDVVLVVSMQTREVEKYR
jgi:hypothetical protein